jgi:hypothetical protein
MLELQSTLSVNLSHYYTFAVTGIKERELDFQTRQKANEHMYKIMKKHGLSIVKVYNDKHYKTYVCNNEVRFYIQRV